MVKQLVFRDVRTCVLYLLLCILSSELILPVIAVKNCQKDGPLETLKQWNKALSNCDRERFLFYLYLPNDQYKDAANKYYDSFMAVRRFKDKYIDKFGEKSWEQYQKEGAMGTDKTAFTLEIGEPNLSAMAISTYEDKAIIENVEEIEYWPGCSDTLVKDEHRWKLDVASWGSPKGIIKFFSRTEKTAKHGIELLDRAGITTDELKVQMAEVFLRRDNSGALPWLIGLLGVAVVFVFVCAWAAFKKTKHEEIPSAEEAGK